MSIRKSACCACLVFLSACATTGATQGDGVSGSATLLAADGREIGTVRLLGTADKRIKLSLDVRDLPAGSAHGIHLHAVGQCQGPGFSSAGPHLNPHGREHGTDNPKGSHLGDLPNLIAAADGKAAISVTLGANSPVELAQLFDADGTAIVLHAAADDNRTDPSGNSGARIACGVLKPA